MRALLFAFLLAIATAVPAFADDGGEYRPGDNPSVEIVNYGAGAP